MNKSYSGRSVKRSAFKKRNYKGGSWRAGGGRRNGGNRGRSQVIDPSRFVKAAKVQEQVEYVPKNGFGDFALAHQIQKNLTHKGYLTPTQIQDQSIPAALSGSDIVGIANTGTGKTAAFLLPMLNALAKNQSQPMLVLAPTRELAQQIDQEFRQFAFGMKIFSAVLIGGSSFGRQLGELRRRPAMIIGTPGRIKDHLERGTLKLDTVQAIALDEVDRMLDMGFINDIRTILGKTPADKQSFFFSATMSPTIEGLIRTFTHDPVNIMAKTADTSDNVEQSVVRFGSESDKVEKLHDVLIEETTQKVLVFRETKRSVEKLKDALAQRGFDVETMHGNKSQGQRQRALRKYKQSEVSIMIATDVAARGIDVADITHVVNYDVPQTYDDYTHRIGRAGRAGRQGFALTFVRG